MSKVSKCSLISEAVVSDSLCFSLPDFLKLWIICLSHMASCLFYLVGTVVRINSRINSVVFLVCIRIALQEETNRMSANALAIVFAPCILRCPDTIDPLQSVQDISKTTAYGCQLFTKLCSSTY